VVRQEDHQKNLTASRLPALARPAKLLATSVRIFESIDKLVMQRAYYAASRVHSPFVH
jgi:hypothetical protein